MGVVFAGPGAAGPVVPRAHCQGREEAEGAAGDGGCCAGSEGCQVCTAYMPS